MSAQEVKQVLSKILTDDNFRRSFGEDAAAATHDLDLTDHEKSMLAQLNITDIEESDLVVAHLMDQSALRIGAVYIT
jgi:hypothetical protein